MGKWESHILSRDFSAWGHSNWTICPLLGQFCSLNFPNLSLFYRQAKSYYPTERKAEMGISHSGWVKGISVHGAFKLDHLHPVRPILFPKSSSFHSDTGRTILIPPQRERLKMGKWESPTQGERGRFQRLGHSNWTVFTLISQFCSLNFPNFPSYTGRPILITPEWVRLKMGKWESPILGKRKGYSAPSIQTGPFESS